VTVSIFASTALDYLNNRYHDPTLGRFISVDPLVAKTRDAYGYGHNNPTSYADPSGLDPDTDASIGAAAFAFELGKLAHIVVQIDYLKSHPGAFAEVPYTSLNGTKGRIDLVDNFSSFYYEIKSTGQISALQDQVQSRIDAAAAGWSLAGGSMPLVPGPPGTAQGKIPVAIPGVSLDYATIDPGMITYKFSWNGRFPLDYRTLLLLNAALWKQLYDMRPHRSGWGEVIAVGGVIGAPIAATALVVTAPVGTAVGGATALACYIFCPGSQAASATPAPTRNVGPHSDGL
jgi:hypothetical protein